MKKWYTYTRNEIIYVQFKDRRTGKKLTAKSTGTRIKAEAEYIIQRWYHDPDSFFNKQQKNTTTNLLTDIIRSSILSETDIRSIVNTAISEVFKITCENITALSQEKKKPMQKESVTFKEFLFTFFDYNNSPYIQQLKRLGKKLPNPERFNAVMGMLNKYEPHF